MNDPQQNRRLQYDLYQRFTLLARLLEGLFPSGPVRVLDVGAGKDDLCRAFLPDRFAITMADADTFGRTDITRVPPGEPLPFADRSFHAVVAMDVLEHVPVAGRAGFLRELARVSGGAVVVAHPVATPAVVAAERLLAAAHLAWFRTASPFLVEHAQHGLPDAAATGAALGVVGLQAAALPNCPLLDWLPFTVLDVALLAQFGVGAAKDEFNLTANTIAGDLRTVGEHYRAFVVGAREQGAAARVTAALQARMRTRGPEHDLPIADLLARTIVQFGQNPAAEALRVAIAAKDLHIRKLEVLLQQQAAERQTLLAAKDEHIQKLETVLQQQAAERQAALAAKEEHIRKLERSLVAPPARRPGPG